jgi:hypothetical protein
MTGSPGSGSTGSGASSATGGLSGSDAAVPVVGDGGRVLGCTPGVEELVITNCGYPTTTSNRPTATTFNVGRGRSDVIARERRDQGRHGRFDDAALAPFRMNPEAEGYRMSGALNLECPNQVVAGACYAPTEQTSIPLELLAA